MTTRPPTEAASTPATSSVRGGLTRYVLAATLARVSDGGAIIAVVLLVNTSGGSPAAAGLLGACVTAPHLLGPFVARRLDTAADGRRIIALACAVHALTLAAAVLAYDRAPVAVPAVLLIASGLVGPFLTGGISSRLPSIAGTHVRQQRRAQGWDVATYGIAGTVGPSLVAVLAGAASPHVAGLALAAGALTAGATVWLLPYQPRLFERADVPRAWQTLGLMLRSGALRRTLVLTVVVALGVAVLPITAVVSADLFGIPASATGALVAAYGGGNLAGALAVMVRPLTGEADQLTPPARDGGRPRACRHPARSDRVDSAARVLRHRRRELVLLRLHVGRAKRVRACRGPRAGVRVGRGVEDQRRFRGNRGGRCGRSCRTARTGRSGHRRHHFGGRLRVG